MKTLKVNTISQQVYSHLKEGILNGEYKQGQWLQETTLSKELNVSRSPIREALRGLVADGLVVEIPNKGVYVKELSRKDIQNIFQYRQALEGYAIYQITEQLTDEQKVELNKIKETLKELYSKGDLTEYIIVDRKFHRYLIECLDNELILEEYDRVATLNQQFRIASLEDIERFNLSIIEHTETIDLMLNGDFKAARHKNCEHLILAKDCVLRMFDERQKSMA